ncbi:MAG TPA: tetratricopeptide repeat protein [Cellvibrio sp.]|nr:tetratricopeptide repeat protein [Cellvibrio sp.]
MKYVNHFMKLVMIVVAIALVSCGGNTKKASSTGAAAQMGLVSTQEFIPVPESDGNGGLLPYTAKPNPYLAQRGRVKPESIAKYIDATRALKQKNYAHAEKMFTQLSESDDDLSGSWVGLGDVATEQTNYAKAVDHYGKALLVNPKNISAYLRLAHAQRLKGDFLGSQNTYARVLAVWPDCPEAHLNLAILYDVYLNHPLRAQKHMEAYQFLTGAKNDTVAKWLTEIQQRTGVPISLVVEKKKAVSTPLS